MRFGSISEYRLGINGSARDLEVEAAKEIRRLNKGPDRQRAMALNARSALVFKQNQRLRDPLTINFAGKNFSPQEKRKLLGMRMQKLRKIERNKKRRLHRERIQTQQKTRPRLP